jgi:polar amino acid transport system substrate-binding protein
LHFQSRVEHESIDCRWWTAAIVALGVFFSSCNLPRDARGTLDRVVNGQMKVGVVHAPPWVIDSADGVHGRDAELVQQVARELNAQIVWVRQPESDLLEAVHSGALDVVIAGLKDDSPWREQVAFSRPHDVEHVDGRTRRHVLALPPGENAWLVRVDQVIYRQAQP